ncbi:hypothetical protein OAH05_00770 [bacterium]|jgi:hypothetical protein|nr:hypothetical protein [Planctomicrobium sp.]MDB4439762.1 hypothetical protein [Planctomicrobium sp.]MDB4802436.1 hypothetical protein [bacterium]
MKWWVTFLIFIDEELLLLIHNSLRNPPFTWIVELHPPYDDIESDGFVIYPKLLEKSQIDLSRIYSLSRLAFDSLCKPA